MKLQKIHWLLALLVLMTVAEFFLYAYFFGQQMALLRELGSLIEKLQLKMLEMNLRVYSL